MVPAWDQALIVDVIEFSDADQPDPLSLVPCFAYLRSVINKSMKETLVPEAIDLLKSRRSVKPREMSGPGPSPAELETILTIGARVPDHGKLAPWRFIVFEGDARVRAGEIIAKVFAG